jgi:hypothetical protein
MLEIGKIPPPPKITKQKTTFSSPPPDMIAFSLSLSMCACLYKTQHLQNNKKPQPTNLQSCMI